MRNSYTRKEPAFLAPSDDSSTSIALESIACDDAFYVDDRWHAGVDYLSRRHGFYERERNVNALRSFSHLLECTA